MLIKEVLTLAAEELGRADFVPLTPVDVLEVTSAAGRCAFSVVAERLILPEGTGEVTVLYSYAPERAGMDGETAFSQKISARLLSYGVAREYLLAGGRYAEAAVWDEKFHAALRAAGLERRKLWLRARRWA